MKENLNKKHKREQNINYNNIYTKKEMLNYISKYKKIQIKGYIDTNNASFLIECEEEKMPKQSQNAELLQEISKMFDRKLQDFEIRFMKKVEAKIDEKLDEKLNEKLKPIYESIEMLKSFHVHEIEEYEKRKNKLQKNNFEK